MGQDLQRIAGHDGRADAVERPDGGAVVAFGVGVDDVVVNQREVVDQLDGHSSGHPDAGVRPGRFGGEDGQGRADALAAGRVHRVTGGISPAQVIGRDASDLWGEPFDGFGQGRGDEPHGRGPGCRRLRWSGSSHLLGVMCRGLGGAGSGRRRAVSGVGGMAGGAAIGQARPGPRRYRFGLRLPWWRATRCRSTPRLRPARAARYRGPGRRRAEPGAARNVAWRSLVTRESRTRASAA